MTRAQSLLGVVAVIAIAGLAVVAVRPIVNPPAAAPHQTAAVAPLAAVPGQLRQLGAALKTMPQALAEVVSLLRQLVVALAWTHCSSGSEPRSVPPGEEC
jgi:hypothetical protein